jgi:hypothetical protein
MSDEINPDRRRFFSTVAMTIAAAQFGIIGSAAAQNSRPKQATVPPIKPGTNRSFGSLKQIGSNGHGHGAKKAAPIRIDLRSNVTVSSSVRVRPTFSCSLIRCGIISGLSTIQSGTLAIVTPSSIFAPPISAQPINFPFVARLLV